MIHSVLLCSFLKYSLQFASEVIKLFLWEPAKAEMPKSSLWTALIKADKEQMIRLIRQTVQSGHEPQNLGIYTQMSSGSLMFRQAMAHSLR
jgi:hypothetical protein